MGSISKIEWTDATWTPIRARVKPDAREIAEAKGYTSLLPIIQPGRVGPHCERVSPGCEHCYSETNNGRCLTHNGTGLPFDRRVRDLVDIFLDEKILAQPLHWKKPRRVFVCSQTDLYGEFVSDETIDRVFAVMALCPQHTFQCLTKRPKRMFTYCSAKDPNIGWSRRLPILGNHDRLAPVKFPLSNVWLGVSVEDQQTADERIPLLLETPAAMRFVSYEPALTVVNFQPWIYGHEDHGIDLSRPVGSKVGCCVGWTPPLDLVIIGGESGPKARTFDIAWARKTIEDCREAGVPVFCKQLGSDAWESGDGDDGPNAGNRLLLWDRKGSDWSEWPEALRVRQFPEASR